MYWREPGGNEGKPWLVQNREEQGHWSFLQVHAVFFQTCTEGQEAVIGLGSFSTFVRRPQLIHRLTHQVIPISRSTSRSRTSVP